MKPNGLFAGDPALQLPTPRSTSSPGPGSEPTPKCFKILAPRFGPKNDPFRQAQLVSSPLIAIPDDVEDPFDAHRSKPKPGRRGIWDARDKVEEQKNDEDLVYLLNQWQTSYTPEKPKQPARHTEPRTNPSDLLATAKGSLFSSAKWHGRYHSRSAASSLPGMTSHKPNSPQSPGVEISPSVKRPHRAATGLTSKRLRLANEDDFDGLPAPPHAKRARLFSTPRRNDGQEPHVRKMWPSTPPSSTRSSPTTTSRVVKLVPLPKRADVHVPHVSTPRRGLSAASTMVSPIPVTTPPSTTRENKINSTSAAVPRNRKRGMQEAELSPTHEELWRTKFAKYLPNTRTTCKYNG